MKKKFKKNNVDSLGLIEKRVNKLTTRLWASIFIVFIMIMAGVLIFANSYHKKLALALSGTYTKSTGDSLLANEWNNLAADFVAKIGDTMTGDLTVNGMIRGNLDCNTVFGPKTDGTSVATCGADEFLLTGGGSCETGAGIVCPANLYPGFVHDSFPDPGNNRWVFDCFGHDWAVSSCGQARAVCCKKQ